MPQKQPFLRAFGQLTTSFQTGRWRHLLTGLFFLISLGVVASILIANWDTLLNYEWDINPKWLIAGLVSLIIDLLLGSYVWHKLIAKLTPYNNLRFDIKSWHYANMARRIPGPIWYIAGRALLYEQKNISKVTTSLISALELALILIAGIVTFLLTLPFWVIPTDITDQLNQSWFLLIILPLCILFVHPRLLTKIWTKLSQHMPEQQLQWQHTLTWLGYYIIVWVVGAYVLFSIINLFTPLPLAQLVPVIGMWAIANTVSVAGTLAFAGMGLREISLTLLLTQFVPAPIALLIAILVRLVWLIGESIAALLSLLL